MDCHTYHWRTKKESSLFKFVQKRQIGYTSKDLFNHLLGLLFLQIECLGRSSNSPLNQFFFSEDQQFVFLQNLRLQNFQIWVCDGGQLIRTPQIKGQSYFQWISKPFKSADFKPLQIRSQSSIKGNPLFIVRQKPKERNSLERNSLSCKTQSLVMSSTLRSSLQSSL